MPTATTILSLGFVLGMRHALAPDHVVAVGAIVSRQRTLAAASRVGALWGVGLVLAHQVGVVDGLFTDSPQWEPK